MNRHLKPRTKTSLRGACSCFAAIALLIAGIHSVPFIANAGDTTPPASGKDDTLLPAVSVEKPAWLTDLSLEVREGYDSDANNCDFDQFFLRTNPKRVSSAFTAVSPKIGIDLAPTFGKDSIFQTFSFGYAPTFYIYPKASDDSYDVHRLTNVIKAKVDAFTFNLENAYSLILGSQYYGPGSIMRNSTSKSTLDPRHLLRGTTKMFLQYDINERFFVRPVASFLIYDLLTDRISAYSNRYDINAGVDLGYRLDPNVAITLGYRYGHQYQQDFAAAQVVKMVGNASNDYQRLLFGIEGKPLKWLTLAVQGGPDFKHYTKNYNNVSFTNTGLVLNGPGKKDDISAYVDANATAQVSRNDTLIFSYRKYPFVLRHGGSPMLQDNIDITLRHNFTKALSAEVGIAYQKNDSLPAINLSDHETDYHAGVRYKFSPNWSADISYTLQTGLKAYPGLISYNLDRSLISIGTKWEF